MAGKKGMRLRSWGTLRRLPSGRYQASYIGPDLARHTAPATYTSKMDGEAWLAAERRLIERQEWITPAIRAAAKVARGVTVAEYFKTWIAQRPSLTESVRLDYNRKLAKHIAPKPLGVLPMSAVTPDACRNWYASLDASQPSARAAAYSMARTIFNGATMDGMFDRNPCVIPGASRQVKAKRQGIVLTDEEMAELAASMPVELRCYVLLSGYLGLRKGEALELRRGDIKPDGTVIIVSRSHTHAVPGKCIVKPTKTDTVRVVDVPPHIVPEVKRHLAQFVAASDDALLFPGTYNAKRDCHHASDDAISETVKGITARFGKAGFVLHDFRRTGGTLTALAGATLPELMKRHGWSSPSVAMRYLQAVDGSGARIAAKLSAMAGTAA